MKIAIIQYGLAWGDVDANLARVERLTEECGACDLILLPEMFASGCMMAKKAPEKALAEKVAVAGRFEEVRARMLAWARAQDAAVVGSTACEEGGKYYNRLVVALPDGVCLYYDKRHCFRMGGENEHYAPGRERLVFDFRGARIAAFVCYDLRFPVWCRNVEDYDLALFVANWPDSRREVWNTLLKARAIENQAYVAAANCVGEDASGLRYAGDSALWDARGRQVCAAAEYNEEILVADCDLQSLREFRRKFAVLADRDGFDIRL